MEEARLKLVIDANEAFRQQKELEKQLKITGLEAEAAGKKGSDAMKGLGQATQTPLSSLQNLDRGLATSTKNIFQLDQAASGAASSLGGGARSGGGPPGGGGAGGGAGGGGVAGAAGAAGAQIASMASNVIAAAAAYLTLRQALRLGEDIIRTRMEFDRLDYGLKAITGSWQGARDEALFLEVETRRLGISFQDTIPEFIKMQAAFTSSGFTGLQADRIFTNMAITTKALGLSGQQTNRVLYDMQEMASLGVVQMRNFRAMMMQLPGAMSIAADAMHMTEDQLHHLIHTGTLAADDFLLPFSDAMAKKFGGAMDEASQNLESNVKRMSNSWAQLKAELGKSDIIKGAAGEIGKLIDSTRLYIMQTEHMAKNTGKGFYESLFPNAQNPAGSVDSDWAMEKKWPWSTPERSHTKLDDVAIYNRMAAEQVAANQAAAMLAGSIGGGAAGGSGLSTERQQTEKQIEEMEKYKILLEQINLERLQGLEKENAQIDLNTTKKLDAFNKILAFYDSHKDKEKIDKIFDMAPGRDPRGAIFEAGEKAKANLAYTAQNREDAAVASEMAGAMEKMAAIQSRVNTEGSGDQYQQGIARINEEYRKTYLTLLQLEGVLNVPESLYEGIKKGRDQQIMNLKPKRYFDFSGGGSGSGGGGGGGFSFSDLQREYDKEKNVHAGIAPVDEASEKAMQASAERMKSIHDEMTRRMIANNVSIHDSFNFGFKSVVDSWGNTAQKMANIGETVANSLSTNMTNAFTGMILGTKSVQQGFAEMAQSIMADIIKVAIQELIVKQIIGSVFTGLTHGHEGFSMGGNRTAFYGSPRFHGGGIVGDEMPMVARRGEVYFTPEQMSVIGKAAGGGSDKKAQSLQIYNGVDQRMLQELLMSNPDMIVNVITSRASVIKRALQ
jgi:tape measure domain-containing protein